LALFERVLRRPLQLTDRIDVGHIARSEQRLGIVFPIIVSDFYAAAGAAPELQTHNRLRQPGALKVEDGYLVFMEENQNIVDWGLRLPLARTGDPEVWQRVNDDPPAWYAEEMSFSEFIVRNFAFVRGVDLSDDELNGLRGTKG
jgi:hypothetical protein